MTPFRVNSDIDNYEGQMKKIVLVLALILLVTSMTSCGARTLITKNNGMYDPVSQVYYSYAPLNYEALGLAKEVFITDANGFKYHELTDAKGNRIDSSKFLYDSENKTLLYNSDIELPTVFEMAPNLVNFYEELAQNVLLISEPRRYNIEKILDIYQDAPTIEYSAEPLDQKYRIMFSSDKYPFLIYTLSYVEFEQDQLEYDFVESLEGYDYRDGVSYTVSEGETGYTVTYNYGRFFLYDRESGLCHKADWIHEQYNSDSD